MAEFMGLLETLREEAANEPSWGGRRVRSNQTAPGYVARLAEAAQFIADVVHGRRPMSQLQEALSTSDFPQLFGDIIDRQILANYAEAPATWERIARRRLLRDFRQAKSFTLDGAQGVLEEVKEGAPYPQSELRDGEYTVQLKKYGRVLGLLWEAIINDDLEAFQMIPQFFGRAARRSENKFATQLYIDASGPHASLYSVGNANLVTGNPALSVNGLQTAFTVLAAQRDSDNEPIAIEGVTLRVPPALEVTAYNIVNALQLELNESGGSTNTRLITANWLRNRLTVDVDPYIPIVANSANGNTSWALFANPDSGRPALQMAFLRGHELPELFMKAANAIPIGGGAAPAEDFDTDQVQYKVRHVFGGGRMDPKMTVASNGSGS